MLISPIINNNTDSHNQDSCIVNIFADVQDVHLLNHHHHHRQQQLQQHQLQQRLLPAPPPPSSSSLSSQRHQSSPPQQSSSQQHQSSLFEAECPQQSTMDNHSNDQSNSSHESLNNVMINQSDQQRQNDQQQQNTVKIPKIKPRQRLQQLQQQSKMYPLYENLSVIINEMNRIKFGDNSNVDNRMICPSADRITQNDQQNIIKIKPPRRRMIKRNVATATKFDGAGDNSMIDDRITLKHDQRRQPLVEQSSHYDSDSELLLLNGRHNNNSSMIIKNSNDSDSLLSSSVSSTSTSSSAVGNLKRNHSFNYHNNRCKYVNTNVNVINANVDSRDNGPSSDRNCSNVVMPLTQLTADDQNTAINCQNNELNEQSSSISSSSILSSSSSSSSSSTSLSIVNNCGNNINDNNNDQSTNKHQSNQLVQNKDHFSSNVNHGNNEDNNNDNDGHNNHDGDDNNPLKIIENLFKNYSISDWQMIEVAMNNNTMNDNDNGASSNNSNSNSNSKCFYLKDSNNNQNWFCGRDSDGRIYLHQQQPGQQSPQSYNPYHQQTLSMINDYWKSNNDDSRNQRNMKDDTDDDQDFTDGNSKHSKPLNNRLMSTNDRSIKAQSIAMISPMNDNKGIRVSGKFKHTRPFQDYKGYYPTPKNELDPSEIILNDHIIRTRTKIAGKFKRKNWTSSFAVLTKYYLYFYKEQKSNNYLHKPDFIIALLNAKCEWTTTNDTSKKNCFKIATFDCETLIQDDDSEKIRRWKDCICKCINELTHIADFTSQNDDFNFRRSRSQKSNRLYHLKDFQIQGSSTISGYGNLVSKCPQHSAAVQQLSSTQQPQSQQSLDKRKKIRERLLNFLKKRPPLESLREKGIIKDENIFGCRLELICLREQSNVPKFVTECITAIERLDIDADGLYRACGNLSTVQRLRFEINQDNYNGLYKEQDVHVLTGLLKMFFREMKEPLFPYDCFESLINLNEIDNRKEKLESMKNLINNLPDCNYYTLKFLLEHLIRVTKHSKQNRMHIQNLAIVFGPTLIRKMNDLNNLIVDMMLQVKQSQIVDFLLQEYCSIFDVERLQ